MRAVARNAAQAVRSASTQAAGQHHQSWVQAALAPRARAPRPTTSTSSATAEDAARQRSLRVDSLHAASLVRDAGSASQAFSKPLPPSSRLVGKVAERAARRQRETAADIVLDKQASVTTGVITPGLSADSRGSAGSSGGSGGSGARRRRENVVTEDALARITDAMVARRTEAARATVRAVLAGQARELSAAAAAASDAASADPVGDMAYLAVKAAKAGVQLPLLPREAAAVRREVSRRFFGSSDEGFPRPGAGGRGRPLDPVATSLPSLTPEAKRLKDALRQASVKMPLVSDARDIIRGQAMAALDGGVVVVDSLTGEAGAQTGVVEGQGQAADGVQPAVVEASEGVEAAAGAGGGR